VFFINVIPIAIALWLVARLGMPDERAPDARVDILGAVLCTLGLGATVYALIEQPNLGWSPLIWVPLVVGILLLIAFVWRQRATSHPVLPLDMFRSRNFSAGNIATLFIYAALSLNVFVVAVYLQQGAGLSATLAGLAGLPTTILVILLSSRTGAMAGRLGPRLFMTVGPLVMAVGAILLLTVSTDFDYWWQVLPSMLLFGLGLAITVSPLTAAILGAADHDRSGIASAVNNAVARVAGLLVVAALAAITGGALDLVGFHRAAIVTAALLVIGGVVSLVGIRNPQRDTAQPAPAP
jgi:predicted MFS family arabinose efflux permease